jgi:hypothetical protein
MALPLGHNSLDKNQIAKLLKEIKAADDELASLRSGHMTRCKKPRKRISEVMARAKGMGLEMPGFRMMVEEYRDQRRAEARREKLDPSEAEALDLYREAAPDFFETTELGRSAKRKRGDGEAALDSLSAD